MVSEGGRGTPEEFMDWAANEWPQAPIPASDAISLAGGAAAALIALGAVDESVGQEWLEAFKLRVHELKALRSRGHGHVRRTAVAETEARFPRIASTSGMATEQAHQSDLRVLSIEIWPDGVILLRFVARTHPSDWPNRLLESVALSTLGGDPIQRADGHMSRRSDEVTYGEQRFRLAESQDPEGLILSFGETSHRIVWI